MKKKVFKGLVSPFLWDLNVFAMRQKHGGSRRRYSVADAEMTIWQELRDKQKSEFTFISRWGLIFS